MTLYKEIGARLRKIRGERTQEKFVSDLDMLSGLSRSLYSTIEIGKRPPSLKLLDKVSAVEMVSYDYLFGICDYQTNIYDPQFQQLMEIWSRADGNEKKAILNYANKTGRKKV